MARRLPFLLLSLSPLLPLGAEPLSAQEPAREHVEEKEQNQEQDQTWQVSFSPNYSIGDYGQGSNTTIYYLPLSVQRLFRDGDITVVVPYIIVKGDCSVVLLSGVPNRTNQRCGAPDPVRGRHRKSPHVPDPVVTNSGLGDVVLRGRYYLVDGQDWVPTIAVTARIKFPTADADKGLGTGEFDEGFGLELTKTLGEKWVAFGDTGYTMIGKPQGIPLRNQWYYDVGLGYYVVKGLMVSAYYEWYRALLQGFQDPQDFLFAVSYSLTASWQVNLSTQIGLSDGSPAYALGFGIGYGF
ncbi:MAG: transporter [Nitrospirota bacterium]